MAKPKKKSKRGKKKGVEVPTLKSASGSGFSFEDKVAALLFAEMLAEKSSLGDEWKVTERIERQAGDWEPFGDLLVTVQNRNGDVAKCGCSVKSNRQISANGCSSELSADLWRLIAKPIFNRSTYIVGLFCAELSSDVSKLLNQFCRQAREEDDPRRLDAKIVHAKHRKIFDSFRNSGDKKDTGLPRHVLARLIPREFDFEDTASRSEAGAVVLCREILRREDATDENSHDLWLALLGIARELRDAGGSVTRERLAFKLRNRFNLKDDPADVAAWAHIRRLSQEWLDQIRMTLPGNLALPRVDETSEMCGKLAKIEANPTPTLRKVTSGVYRPVTPAGVQQVRAKVEAPSVTPYEYLFERERQAWWPIFSDKEVHPEGTPDESFPISDTRWQKESREGWKLVSGLKHGEGAAVEKDAKALELAKPESGAFVLVSLRRRRKADARREGKP